MTSFPMPSMRTRHLGVWLAISLMAGCSSDPERGSDAGSSDAAVALDSGHTDDDAGDAVDAGDTDDAGDAGDASTPPAPPTDLGVPCTVGTECSGKICRLLPGGYCTARCADDATCGPGNLCVSERCYAGCASHADCTRADYFCTTLDYYVDENNWVQLERGCYIGRTLGGTAFIPDGLTIVLTDAVGGTLELSASGPFTFPNRVAFDSQYSVTITPPSGVSGLSCMGTGLQGTALGDVTEVSILCGRQAIFTTPGTHAWVVPEGVTAVSVVAVGSGGRGYDNRGGGGGELCYQNDIPVTPGATIAIVVGDLHSQAPGGHHSSFDGTLVAHGGSDAFGSPAGWTVPGGTGGTVGTCFNGGDGSNNSSSGGAAGYAGIGGHARAGVAPQNGAGGGGGGGEFGTPGGGVGLEGIGANGIAPGGHGSQASAEVVVVGGGGTTYNNRPQTGQHGGVRVIWGAGRSYPSQAGNL